MPYLTIKPYLPRKCEPKKQEAYGKRHFDEDNAGLQNKIAGFEDETSLIHDPMTLDQFYYSGMRNTDQRDGDQVLSKYLERSGHDHDSISNGNVH